MRVAPSTTRRGYLLTKDPISGELLNADSTPTVALDVNGATSGISVTVTNVTTGKYRYSYSTATLAAGDQVQELPSAVIGGVTYPADPIEVWIDASVDSRLSPTTAGRTLDVTATGGAGIDWANIENPTTTVGLTGTTVDLVANAVDADALAADAVTEIAAGVPSAAAIVAALGGSSITYNGPVADDGSITLYAGDDYSGSQSLVWTITGWAGVSVNGEAVTLALMQRRAKYDRPGGTTDLEVTTGTASQVGSTITVTVPITSTQTLALLVSPPLDEEHYQLQVRSNTTKQRLVNALCTVRKNALST